MIKGNTYEVLFMHDVLVGPTIICTLDIGFQLTRITKLKLNNVNVDIKDKDFSFVEKVADARDKLEDLFQSLEDTPVYVSVLDVFLSSDVLVDMYYVEKDGSQVSINESFNNWVHSE